MERIKNNKKLEKQRREEEAKRKAAALEAEAIVVSTQKLNIGDDYAALDSGEDNDGDGNDGDGNKDVFIAPPSNAIIVDGGAPTSSKVSVELSASSDNANSLVASTKATAVTTATTLNGVSDKKYSSEEESDDQEDGTPANNYVIADDVDVDDGWMVDNDNKDGDSDSEVEENDVDDDDAESQSNSVVRELF